LPFVQLALDNPIHDWVGQLLLGQKISELPEGKLIRSGRFFVKESVFPFSRFPGLDPTLSSRMRSTGQVVGIEDSFGRAYYKSQLSENPKMPSTGKVFVSARDSEKEAILEISKRLSNLGFSLVSTEGTARFLSERGIKVGLIHKISGGRPNIVDLIINGEISMVVNIPGGFRSKVDEQSIHRTAIEHNLPLITTASGAYLMVRGMEEIRSKPISLFPLSD
jgi:carbamoyl-phosphate synthase large subunit